MKVVRIEKDAWAELSEKAHLIVFNEVKKPEMERIDFALLVECSAGIPMQYVTCRELDSTSLYFQYGGSFPGTKGSPKSARCMDRLLDWACLAGYQRVAFLVENTNEAMLKLAMRCGFLIVGLRTFKGLILLEHNKEFQKLGEINGQV